MKTIRILITMIGMMVLALGIGVSFAQNPSVSVTNTNGVSGDPKIKITSKLPDILVDGREYVLNLHATNMPSGVKTRIRFLTPYGQPGWGYDLSLSDFANGNGSFKFKPRVLSEKSERYKILITVSLSFWVQQGQGGYYYDMKVAEVSSKYFVVVLPGPKRSIKIIEPSPTIERTVVAGGYMQINWKGTNLPPNAQIELKVWQPNPRGDSSYFQQIVPNTGGVIWNIPPGFIKGRYVLSMVYLNEYWMHGTPVAESKFKVE